MSVVFTNFGRYEIRRRLRRGGMGVVYLAYDTESKEEVALKLIELDDDDREACEAIEAEEYGVKLQKALCEVEPNVPAVKEFDRKDGHFYIAMEYIEGEDLSDKIARGKLSYGEVITIATAISNTLHRAHTFTSVIDGRSINQIVHGDIKPKNIRLTKEGGVKLLDFGIAKALSLTRKLTHNDFGTIAYCSPERLETGHIDAQSDLWSFGVLLYEMASGTLPFQALSQRELERVITSGQQPPPLPADCPKLLKDLIAKALAHDQRRRYQSAAAITNYLNSSKEGETRRVRGRDDAEATPAKADGESSAHSLEREGEGEASGGKAETRSHGVRLLPLLVKAFLAIVLCSLLALGAMEWAAWSNKRQLRDDLIGASFARVGDSDPFINRYRELSKEGFLKAGLPELRALLKHKLADLSGRVFTNYEKGSVLFKESDWKDAKERLARVVEIGAGDLQIQAMMLFCDGQIERINGDAQKAKKRQQDAAARYNSAIRDFNDAAGLQPQWPDPHLGLAVVYTYGLSDAARAASELDRVKELGLTLGDRETAIRADGLRMSADNLYVDVRTMATPKVENYQEVKRLYEQALEKYRLIPAFSDDTRQYIRDLDGKIQELERRIEELGPAKGGEDTP